jgi:hypothetical protein
VEFGLQHYKAETELSTIKRRSTFDEVALANDISAATAAAGAPQPAPAPAPVTAPAPSLADRMKKLNELRDAGLITDVEYAERRQKIIEET